MKVAGIIAEYNPFHNGHVLLIEKARQSGATHIVACMSGNFVQRGENAVFHHRERTLAALRCGVDLVVQLPTVYALSGARSFAGAGVSILDSLGCVDELVFGSECGDINKIIAASEAVYSDDVNENIVSELSKGISYACARENALRAVDAQAADIIKTPNNILAVEYTAAIKRIGSNMVPVTFAREGCAHDSDFKDGDIASASAIRELILNKNEWKKYVPEAAYEVFSQAIENGIAPADMSRIETAILCKMRTITARELRETPDISEGIENRILAAAKQATSLSQLYSLAKTKRYSHARIRRIVMNSFLGITADQVKSLPPYIRIMGFNSAGAELIREAKKSAKLPLVSKTADVFQLSENAEKCFKTECIAGDVFALCFEKAQPCEIEKKYISINL